MSQPTSIASQWASDFIKASTEKERAYKDMTDAWQRMYQAQLKITQLTQKHKTKFSSAG